MTPAAISGTSRLWIVSGPFWKALLPLPKPGASMTARPVPAQRSRAAWMRPVSGGVVSSVVLNSPVVVASAAPRTMHRRGRRGSRGSRG